MSIVGAMPETMPHVWTPCMDQWTPRVDSTCGPHVWTSDPSSRASPQAALSPHEPDGAIRPLTGSSGAVLGHAGEMRRIAPVPCRHAMPCGTVVEAPPAYSFPFFPHEQELRPSRRDCARCERLQCHLPPALRQHP